ncbi:hypothetical protein PENTCL1PPCAC_8627, partial [Pristionchus entomophagus]
MCEICKSGMCSLVCDGQVYVYRVCDDPFRDRKPLAVPVDMLKSLGLMALHGETAIFTKIAFEPIMPSVTRMG